MTRGDFAMLVDAVADSRPARIVAAAAVTALAVAFLGLMVAACAIDCALGNGDEWPQP